MDITPVILAIIGLVFALISVYVAPEVKRFLSTKLSVEQMYQLEMAVDVAVKAAEQIFRNVSNGGYEKKQYVLKYLKDVYGYDVDTDEIDAFIEAKVIELFGKEEVFK